MPRLVGAGGPFPIIGAKFIEDEIGYMWYMGSGVEMVNLITSYTWNEVVS